MLRKAVNLFTRRGNQGLPVGPRAYRRHMKPTHIKRAGAPNLEPTIRG